jgi:deoxyribodipyrimidine photo-lyase
MGKASTKKEKIMLFWFRRDLRLDDNHGLHQALSSGKPVLPLFIFDPHILKDLKRDDHRVEFIHATLERLDDELAKKHQVSLAVYKKKPEDVFEKLLEKYDVEAVYSNTDYEPYATERDKKIRKLCRSHRAVFRQFKDQVIFEKKEILKLDGGNHIMYSSYAKKWKATLDPKEHLPCFDTDIGGYVQHKEPKIMTLDELGFVKSYKDFPRPTISPKIIRAYPQTRDFPADKKGTTHMSTHLRFGLVSIRALVSQVIDIASETYLNELIWREYFMQLLWHYPRIAKQSYRKEYDKIKWRNNEQEFELWKKGMTGYPIVDAGMRELNTTGYMHNRVRMIAASFLTKHLLIDWRWGEQYFAEKLFDYEMSSNVGNWQWVAGSGADASPYFRIFNPETQMQKFDPKGVYVKKWVPEYFGVGYFEPMVDHTKARKRALEAYKKALDK